MTHTTDDLVTAAFTIPQSDKARIDQMAKEQDPHNPNASRIMREILKEFFATKDTPTKSKSTKTVAA